MTANFFRRTRIVNFRLTQHEYDKLRTACTQEGQRISEFARNAVLESARERIHSDSAVQEHLLSLDEKLSHLLDSLKRKR